MDLTKAYAVDKDAALEGKWFTTAAGMRVKVAKMANNPRFKAAVMRLQKPHLALLRSKTDTTDLSDEITTKAMARTILLDWENEENGEAILYTSDAGFEALTEYPDFKEDISALAIERDNFRPEEVAEK